MSRPKMQALALDMGQREHERRRQVRVVEVERPTEDDLGPGDVLVQIQRAMFCLTDKEIASQAGHGVPTEGVDHLGLGPVALIGHEAGGTIVGAGGEVDPARVGQSVALMVREGGDCVACRAGRADMCYRWTEQGEMAEHGIFRLPGWMCSHAVVPAAGAVPVPEGLAPGLACFGEPSSIGGKSLCEARIVGQRYPGWGEPDEQGNRPAALVLGAGGVGLPTVPVLLSAGFEVVVAAWTRYDPQRPHLKAAMVERLGARYVSTQQTGVARLKEMAPKGRFDIIVDMCGRSDVVAEVMTELCDPGAVVVLTSITGGDRRVDFPSDRFLHNITMNNGTVIGVVNADVSHFEAGLAGIAWAEQRSPGWTEALITRRFEGLAEAAAGFWDVMDDPANIRAAVELG